MKIVIGGHDKMYRDLYVTVGNDTFSLEDIEWEETSKGEDICGPEGLKGLTLPQVEALGKFSSGDFEIFVAEDGALSVVLT